MSFLYWVADLRIPLITELMLLITHLGEETAFLVIALVLFWCINKRQGYYILAVGFVGTMINQFLKMSFRIPRPWERSESFQAVEAAKAEATGFSFPSGHTQNGVGTFGAIGINSNRRWTRWLCVVLATAISFSRLYLGVHTPQDVLVSVAIALLLIFVVYPFVFGGNGCKRMLLLFGIMLLLNMAYLCFVHQSFALSDATPERVLSGFESGYTLLGALVGFIIAYVIDVKWINFPVMAKWWAQIVKVIIGICLVLLIKIGLKSPLNMLFGELIGRTVRYFLVVVAAAIGWPMTFKWFARLGSKE